MGIEADGRVLQALGVVLGVEPLRLPSAVDRRALKTAFRRRAHLLHPDKASAVGATEQTLALRFAELKSAYDFLVALLDGRTAAPAKGCGTPSVASAGRATRPEPPRAVLRYGCHPSSLIPRRRLRFAQYLYYARVIDWNTLLRAMRWQHRIRPRLGEIARECGYLSLDDVGHVLRHRAHDERFGDAALRLGRIDHVRLLTVLARQHRHDRPIGRYFVEHKILTRAELGVLLQRHWSHNLDVAAAQMRAYSGVGPESGRVAHG
jgi:hypothetical protein